MLQNDRTDVPVQALMKEVAHHSVRNDLADISYDLTYGTMSPLRKAGLLHQQAMLLSYLGNPLARARLERLRKVLFRLAAYDLTHGRVFARIDRNAEEALYGPRVCPGCNEDIEANCFDTVCRDCQFDGPEH